MLAIVQNPPFSNVVASGIATVSLPIGMSYDKIVLKLGGTTFTKAMITDIKIKLNGKIIFQDTGSRTDSRMQYRGHAANAAYLSLDFTERFARSREGQLLGNINTAEGVSSFTLEVTIAGATAPTLESYAQLSEPKKLGAINKVLVYPATFSAGGKFPLKIVDGSNGGPLIKRIHFFHGGNMTGLEVKKNGVVIYDVLEVASNSFLVGDYGRTAQSNVFTYDPLMDNNQSNMLTTGDARDLQFNVRLSASDTVNAVAEFIDALGNL